MRLCTGCRKDLPLVAFNRDARLKSGRRARCRECDRKPVPWEARESTTKLMRTALSFSRLVLERRHGATACEIAAALEITERTAHRLLRAGEHAGWPLVKVDGRWRLA